MQPLEQAVEVALIVIQTGGSTSMADRTFRNILKGYGEEGGSAAWRMDAVVAGGAAGERSSMVMRRVGPIGVSLDRASEAAVLGERLARGEVEASDLESEIARINGLACPYGRWILIAAAACTAAFFSQIPGGDWGAAGIAFVAAGLGQFIRVRLQAMKFTVANVTLICG